ncbi:hypothetical protein TVAG_128350 [Trichomonas vaginalis G3]|uniref:Uncharacterized protein n=1 Tax=Trichomonas vaginalis (strain ATCC PRA-98 / G3) TaxID=412133 RepID=A2EBJ6_TRIV3|nr:hypothetical protein TVAGG3_0407240 [Trichomonas vaginalis G3]EAY10026.1 hypothetical protein TVAG_128350 [Trichomonas vaginalis G3]KAI5535106.1 hypothetical protein TVAGG3_0407240 [Trichomonas vaginalis G3]|eukprot:XP_001322249.1 hypothetical protein [Trichomonas vaginalis G3]
MSNIPPDFEDIEGQKRVRAIYLNSIASAIANNCKSQIVTIKKPNDSIAERIAQEIVSEFILSHSMENAGNILEAESQNQIRVRHDISWLGRKLQLDDSSAIVPQLVEAICPQNHTTTVEDEQPTQRQHLHVRVKKDSNGNIIENPHEVLSRPDAIKRIRKSDLQSEQVLTTKDVDDISLPSETRHSHHSHHSHKGHHHHRHHREGYGQGLTQYYEEQENIFTQLEPEIPEANIADAHYGLSKDKASQIAKPQRPSSRYVPSSPGGSSASSQSRYADHRRHHDSDDRNPVMIVSNLPPPEPEGPLGTPHHRIPKIFDPTMEPESTWDVLEHPEKEESLIRKCPFDERINRLLSENPNYPAPPMPQQVPLSSAIERQNQLQSLTKSQLVEKVVLMQEQQQLLLQQMSQLSSQQGSSFAGSLNLQKQGENSSIMRAQIDKSSQKSISSMKSDSNRNSAHSTNTEKDDDEQSNHSMNSENSSNAASPEPSNKSDNESVQPESKNDEDEEEEYEYEEEEEEEVVYEYED